MRLPPLPYPYAAAYPWNENGVAFSTNLSSDMPWQVSAGTLRYTHYKVGVPPAELRILLISLPSEPMKNIDPFQRYLSCVRRHSDHSLGDTGRFIRLVQGISVEQRGGAARLARGAHNPKVDSSNLSPATFSFSLLRHFCLPFCLNKLKYRFFNFQVSEDSTSPFEPLLNIFFK